MYRDHTKVIKIGNRVIGGGNPILIQSMTNTKTEDVEATVAQILSLEKAGCDIIRCAVPTMEAAKALSQIKKQIHIPLVADIHFDYRLAIAAMENGADKIRINPGNIGSKERIQAVVDTAKERNIPIRVGVNSGSLEKELVEKYHLYMDTGISWCEDFMFNLEYIRYAERFIALKVPIYYYVKTKGSLVSQSVTISNTVKMKLEIFEYYNNFYKHTFDEAYYEKNRLRIYHFLIDSAKDGFVMPSILPGSKKLGSERTSVSPQALNGHGVIIDIYRSKMLLYRYLESAAIKHDLTLNDACLLLALENPIPFTTKKELANYAQLPLHILSLSLSHLSMRGFIQPLPIQHFSVCLLETATPVLDDLKAAINDFECTCMRDFTKEESCLYRQLSERIHENVLESLR